MLRQKAVVLLLVVGSSLHAQAQNSTSSPASASVEVTMRSLADQWLKANISRDTAVHRRIFADDFLYVVPSGQTIDKSQFIAGVAGNTGIVTSAEIENFKVRVYAGGTVAVTNGDSHVVGREKDGRAFDARSRFTSVWLLRDGSWRCVSGHSSDLSSAEVIPAGTAAAGSAREHLAADTPKQTVSGAKFIAPADWSFSVRGPATILEPPEGDSRIALIDVRAPGADSAVALAWAAYMPDHRWPLKVVTPEPNKDGWSERSNYAYQTSPNEKRDVGVFVQRSGDSWTAAVYDMSQATAGKRLAAVRLIYDGLLPKGFVRETFAGKKAATLDAARLAKLSAFTEKAMKELGIPGVAVGIIQDGKVVFADGFGVRELGKPEKPDANTMFMVASNTKALTTLMLAKHVDAKHFGWETPVTSLLPSFKLGDTATTRQVLVKHLICACTGLPRQDLEWLFEFKDATPQSALRTLGTMQPTSTFGEMFQYSNPMAAAAGYAGGHVAYPGLELGAAYDEAMRTLVFQPLGMTSTTFDYAKALAGNHAWPHSPDVDGKTNRAAMEVNYSIIPVRPAGAAWSNVRDMLRYVAMELAEGKLPDGTQYIRRETLLARRARQVDIGKHATYGMGLVVDVKYNSPVVHHGGDMIGFHSDMMWLPEQGVGAVVLTNGDPGWVLRNVFRRKLLEVLFDGRDEADADVASQAKSFYAQLAADRKLLTIPADTAESSKLARHYDNDALGVIDVRRDGGRTVFDFGEFRSEVASRKNPDGSISFLTITPGSDGFEFVVGSGDGKRLTIRDAQHEYVFTGAMPTAVKTQ
jgi:CubicO group peptidase (beta-lactamase class C family)/ketosteroid isomerase-like protein